MPRQAVITRALERATYSMTASEFRLLSLAIAKIDSMSSDPVPDWIEVSVQEFGGNNASRDICAALNRLYHRTWKYRFNPRDSREGRFIVEKETSTGEGIVSLKFSDTMYEHISQINGVVNAFIKYNPEEIQNLRGKYSPRLYLMLRQCMSFDAGYIQIDVQQLRKSFDLQDKYKLTSKLRQKVLQAAIDEITEKTDFSDITIEDVKRGTRIVYWKLRFKHPAQVPPEEKKKHARRSRRNTEYDSPTPTASVPIRKPGGHS